MVSLLDKIITTFIRSTIIFKCYIIIFIIIIAYQESESHPCWELDIKHFFFLYFKFCSPFQHETNFMGSNSIENWENWFCFWVHQFFPILNFLILLSIEYTIKHSSIRTFVMTVKIYKHIHIKILVSGWLVALWLDHTTTSTKRIRNQGTTSWLKHTSIWMWHLLIGLDVDFFLDTLVSYTLCVCVCLHIKVYLMPTLKSDMVSRGF